MSEQWQQSGLLFTKTKVYGKHPSYCRNRSGFPRYCHWILFAQTERRDILDSPQELINRLLVRRLILGDGAYPPTTWQVKPYLFNLNLLDTEKSFSKLLSLARVTVKRAFGVLKGR